MKNMTLENVAKACGGRLVCEGEPSRAECASVVIDSRQAGENSIFIAVRGERVDGHRFLPDVFQKGALGAVCERLPENAGGPCILVEDSLKALRQIAAFYREQLPVKVVGITGSVGKTSTKEFVAAVLARKYRVHKTQGNFNNEIGVPLTVLSMPEDTEVAVLEMGINHFGEMRRLSRIAQPDICVMTNIGQCHLEFLGSREGILKAKSEIFEHMREDGRAVLNGDDDMLAAISQVREKRRSCMEFRMSRTERRQGNTACTQKKSGRRACSEVKPCSAMRGRNLRSVSPFRECIWCITRLRRRR